MKHLNFSFWNAYTFENILEIFFSSNISKILFKTTQFNTGFGKTYVSGRIETENIWIFISLSISHPHIFQILQVPCQIFNSLSFLRHRPQLAKLSPQLCSHRSRFPVSQLIAQWCFWMFNAWIPAVKTMWKSSSGNLIQNYQKEWHDISVLKSGAQNLVQSKQWPQEKTKWNTFFGGLLEIFSLGHLFSCGLVVCFSSCRKILETRLQFHASNYSIKQQGGKYLSYSMKIS